MSGAPFLMMCQAEGCGLAFPAPVRKQGGGRPSKFCSATCRSRDWARGNVVARAESLARYDAKPESQEAKRERGRKATLSRYGVDQEWFDRTLAQQARRCCGCDGALDSTTARIDHCHTTGAVRGLLCDHCNWALGHARDSQATLTRLINYLKEHS